MGGHGSREVELSSSASQPLGRRADGAPWGAPLDPQLRGPPMRAPVGRAVEVPKTEEEGGLSLWARAGACTFSLFRIRASNRLLLQTVWVYAALQGATDQALPAAYKALEAQLGLTPTQLGSASSLARLAHAFACPLWGLVVDSWQGLWVLALTASTWGVCTALLGALWAPWQLLPLVLLSGFATAATGPVTQKLLGDASHREALGAAFGTMACLQSLGRMLALLSVTGLSTTAFLGLMGWRWSFFVLGFATIALGLFAAKSALPGGPLGPLSGTRGAPEGRPWRSLLGALRGAPSLTEWWAKAKELRYVGRNKSVWIMLLMGVFNGIPRSALGFMPMWLQLCGQGSWGSSWIVSSSLLTAMLVSPFVGRAVDAVHKRYPERGRAFLAQLAIVLPLGCLLGGREWEATVFSLVSTTEAVGAAALGAPLVGLLSDKTFGYIPVKRVGAPHGGPHRAAPPSSGAPPEEASQNAEALSKALLLTTVGPWMLAVCLYFVLMLTYKADTCRVLQMQREQQRSSSSSTAAADLELGPFEEEGDESDLELMYPMEARSLGGPIEGPPSSRGLFYMQVASSVQTPQEEQQRDCPPLAVAMADDEAQQEHSAAAAAVAAADAVSPSNSTPTGPLLP
ncbi:hypothetical protein Esti_002092 [Eimeria stiedai]